MSNEQPVPRWLWAFANGALVVAVLGIGALAWALAQGVADPPRTGNLWLFDDFKGEANRWTFISPDGINLRVEGALVAEFAARPEQLAFGLTDAPAGDFTLEVAGTPRANSNGLAYGLVFGWQDETHYSAVLVNGNGYAEAYQQNGAERTTWFEWQQWPHAVGGDNRVQVEVSAGRMTARVNDEWLMETALATWPTGKIGVLARGADAPGAIVFSWVKVWAGP